MAKKSSVLIALIIHLLLWLAVQVKVKFDWLAFTSTVLVLTAIIIMIRAFINLPRAFRTVPGWSLMKTVVESIMCLSSIQFTINCVWQPFADFANDALMKVFKDYYGKRLGHLIAGGFVASGAVAFLFFVVTATEYYQAAKDCSAIPKTTSTCDSIFSLSSDQTPSATSMISTWSSSWPSTTSLVSIQEPTQQINVIYKRNDRK